MRGFWRGGAYPLRMSPELQIVVYVAAVVLFLLAAWQVRHGRLPAQELGWVALTLVTLVPLWAAIEAA